MKHLRLLAFASMVGVVCLPGRALGQSSTTGAIAGTARDATGAVLPGVTVEAASPALIEKVRVAVTDSQGNYKIIDLRPGTYSVTFTLPGFSTFAREGILLSSGFTATANAEMAVGSLEETVTVSGASPVVDVQNVTKQVVLTREVQDSLPAGKDIPGLIALTLGMSAPGGTASQDVGGTQGINWTPINIHGSRTGDSLYLHDGTSLRSMNFGAGSGRKVFSNPAAVEETSIVTGANSAESESLGVMINIVPKDGGNTFAAYFNANWTNGDLQGENLTPELEARGITAPPKVLANYDVAGGFGGPILKDKLWFRTGHYTMRARTSAPGRFHNSTIGTFVYTPDFSRPGFQESYVHDPFSLRLTWQAAEKHKLTFYHTDQSNCYCRLGAAAGAPDATGNVRLNPARLTQVTWTYPATNRLLFSATEGYMLVNQWTQGIEELSLANIPLFELTTSFPYNSSFGSPLGVASIGIDIFEIIDHQKVTMAYVTGSHAFKVGVDHQRYIQTLTRLPETSPPPFTYFLFNGVPIQLQQFLVPLSSEARVKPNLGLYAQDQWSMRRLTLNLGLRFDYLAGYTPDGYNEQGRFGPALAHARVDEAPKWTDLSPRIGAAYDLFGDGRTGVKASISRGVALEGTDTTLAQHPANRIQSSTTRTWVDANGNWTPDCDLRSITASGECGPMSNSRFGTAVITSRFADDVLRGFGVRGYTWQASAGFQHELRAGMSLNIDYFRTSHGNFRVTDNLLVTPADYDPFCIAAPRDTRLPDGGGYQICGLYDIKPARFGQSNNLIARQANYGDRSEVFNGVDVAVHARFGDGGFLRGGVSTGQTVIDNCTVIDSPQQSRFCKTTLPWSAQAQIKASAIYPLRWGVQLSTTYQNLAGIPLQANYVARNPEIAPSLGRNLAAGAAGTATVTLLEPNTMFEERLNQVDVRFTKIFRLGRTRLKGSFDIYNMLNASTVLGVNAAFGPQWLRPTRILDARLFKFGGQIDF
ncbi:MAG: TonB-dependent receptor [Acidimicrobiia bacterium]|nr:TonB-dependent receptor [Acidimicrobiia bacterium]